MNGKDKVFEKKVASKVEREKRKLVQERDWHTQKEKMGKGNLIPFDDDISQLTDGEADEDGAAANDAGVPDDADVYGDAWLS